MTNIYFIRHAEPNYNNHNDELRELTEKGLLDRKLVTEYLSKKSIDIILSSPYKRSVDTIQDFADSHGLTIEKVYDFRERKIDSIWIEDFNTFTRMQWENFDYKLTDGETLREVQNRNISALKSVLEQHGNKNIVIGSHGTALSTIINYYDQSFVHNDFENIKRLMPWIVHFEFDGQQCIAINKINIFDK